MHIKVGIRIQGIWEFQQWNFTGIPISPWVNQNSHLQCTKIQVENGILISPWGNWNLNSSGGMNHDSVHQQHTMLVCHWCARKLNVLSICCSLSWCACSSLVCSLLLSQVNVSSYIGFYLNIQFSTNLYPAFQYNVIPKGKILWMYWRDIYRQWGQENRSHFV